MPVEILGRIPVEQFLVGQTEGETDALQLCRVTESSDISAQQIAWEQAATPESAGAVQINWPAILEFHPEAVTFMLRSGEQAQALLQVRENHLVRCSAGHRGPLHYVSFIEVAPWNRPNAAPRRYKGLGQFMLRVVAARALETTPVASIGLHSLASAVSFYNAAGFTVRHCPNEFRELYLEADEASVRRLIA